MRKTLPPTLRDFVEISTWRVATTYASTWPHEYVVRTIQNQELIVALARHISEHGIDESFYSRVFRYHHENGKVYWCMDSNPESVTLINRCNEGQTYEDRLRAGSLPPNGSATIIKSA
jgi:hypothetical protein